MSHHQALLVKWVIRYQDRQYQLWVVCTMHSSLSVWLFLLTLQTFLYSHLSFLQQQYFYHGSFFTSTTWTLSSSDWCNVIGKFASLLRGFHWSQSASCSMISVRTLFFTSSLPLDVWSWNWGITSLPSLVIHVTFSLGLAWLLGL